jgi:hypothetical protein
MPDLETTIRTALQTRADEITGRDLRRPVRDGRPPSRRGQWLLAAAAVLLVLAVALPIALLRGSHDGTGQQPAGGENATALFGWKWDVTAITDSQGRFDVPARLAASIVFPEGGGHVGGNDGVNYSYGVLRVSGDGYDVSDVGTTLAGYIGKDPIVLRTIAGVDALFQSPNSGAFMHVTAKLDGDTLTLSAGDVTVTATRGESEAPAATSASATGSATSIENPVDPISGSYSPGSSGPATP